jgi:HPt (histidine-containing phosphotransfer) domain-containing protein
MEVIMAQVGANSPEMVLNFPELLARVEDDRELLCELLGLFKEESTELMESLSRAALAEDMDSVRKISHMLKGMLANLSANRAAAAASRLEEIGRDMLKVDLPVALVNIRTEMALLLPNVNSYLQDEHS